MKYIIALFLLFPLSLIAQQNSFTISGRVISLPDSMPMKNASVFAENTTTGTATDDNGNFKLVLPSGGYNIIVTYTGYNTETQRVSAASLHPVLFEMKVKEKDLADVVVVSSNEVKDGWNKYGSFFLDEFLGKTSNRQNCYLLNPEVLKFFYSRKKKRLKILSDEPLIINNKSLGYNIKYSLDSFTHEYETTVSVYSGFPFFEEIEPVSETEKSKWADSREEAYSGSVLHFMRSLYNEELKENSFEVQFIATYKGKDTALKLNHSYGALNYEKDDSTGVVKILPNQTKVGVFYTKEKPAPAYISSHESEPSQFQFSTLYFQPQQPIFIERNGYFYDQNDIVVGGYWTWAKIADLLPYDYLIPTLVEDDNIVEPSDNNSVPQKTE